MTTQATKNGGLTALPVFYDARMVADAQSFSPSAGKPRDVVESWKQLGVALDFPRFDPASREQLYLAHAPAFVEGVLEGRVSNGFGNRSMAVAAALPWTSGAMLAAARAAIANGRVAIAPVSGFHHARHDRASGFCTFNGLIVAARSLQAEGLARRVGILDFDQHYGDGTDQILRHLGLTDIAHYTAGAEYGTPDQAEEFLVSITSRVRQFADCDVLLYQAGADPHIHDPLGGWLTDAQLAQRDRLVFETCRDLGLPVAWDLAGGYQSPLRKVLDIHDATMRACAAVYLVSARSEEESMTDPTNAMELGENLVRRVMAMVAVLHVRGLESLYLYSAMSGTGSWRYRIGAMDAQQWPRPVRDPLQVFDSTRGSDGPEWGDVFDDPIVLADKFEARYPRIAEAAHVPNPAHAAWYRHMLAISEPLGMLVYDVDYKTDPRPEFWDGQQEVFLDLPPGLKSRDSIWNES